MPDFRPMLIMMILLGAVGGGIVGYLLDVYQKRNTGIETRHEKLVFSATGCKVYQVTIKNEYGFDQIYVALNPAASKRPTTAYPTCRIAH